MRLFRAQNHRRMPWKNGGGVTTEIAVFPDNAGLDDFAWRISMATVASEGRFSLFPGVDRTLAILEGEGIVLSIDGQPDVTLTRRSPPYAFPADQPTSARLVSGPILDFNVMTRRGRFEHRVDRLASAQSIVRNEGALTVVFCAGGSAIVSSMGERGTLGTHDAAIANAACEIEVGEGAELYVTALLKA